MKITEETAEGIKLQVPAYRVDVQRPCDVVEDILRIYGYNNVEIPTQVKSSLTLKGDVDRSNRLQNLVAESACGLKDSMRFSTIRSRRSLLQWSRAILC